MPKTLLLADDSVTIQKVVGISFANEDIVLLTVDNGDDAIARAKEARPDVILADVVMPGKNGYEVCQAVKSDPALANTPVLLLTGTFEAFDEQRAARAGADGHITKPFEAQSLVDKVNALLAGREAPAAAPAAPTRVEVGVLRPVRVEAPAPAPAHAPVSHTADTAYDFFDEEITAPRPGASARKDATILLGGPPPAPAAGPYDFDAEGDGDADPHSTPFAAPSFAPAADAVPTTVVEAAPAPALDDWSTPLASAAGRETTPRFGADDLGFESSPSGPAEDESRSLFDGGFPASAEAPPADVRSETRLLGDPFEAAGDAFDPSATRVADAFDAVAPPPAAGAFDAGDAREPDAFDPGATHLSGTALPAQAPLDALDELELEGGLDAGDPFGEAVFDPTGARDYDVSSSDLGAPLAAAPPPRETVLEPVPAAWSSAWPEDPEPAPAAAPELAPASAAFAAPAPAALDAAAGSTALGRDELRDMLEKMAWEAFGPLTERLVRDAVDRIERVAWEVIPQLAETLIREEIRKLKGD